MITWFLNIQCAAAVAATCYLPQTYDMPRFFQQKAQCEFVAAIVSRPQWVVSCTQATSV